jgi:hypothetical protein
MQITGELLKRYLANPLGMDETIRLAFKIPPDKYYSVSSWPEERAGFITITEGLARKAPCGKISKSDQQPKTE